MTTIKSVRLYGEHTAMLEDLMKKHSGKRIASTESSMMRQALEDKYINDIEK